MLNDLRKKSHAKLNEQISITVHETIKT